MPHIKPLTARNTIIWTQKPEQKFLQQKIMHESFYPKESQLHGISRKLKRRFIYEKVVDLHGLTVKEAFNKLLVFFANCQLENIKNVIVITGGNDLKTSVIRSSFQKWIRESFGQYVHSYSQANIQHGGQGSFYVVLKKIKL
jgi:DNA-nicking Smr family endonuclease